MTHDPSAKSSRLADAKASVQDDANGGEELAHHDDAVIGRAFRWSFFLIAIIAMIAIAFVLVLKRKPAQAATKMTQVTAPVTRNTSHIAVPRARFTDVTQNAGIDFVHSNGAMGDKLLPETMGGGVAFFDFDNDGDQDLLFVNSTFWPDRIPAGQPLPTTALYKNAGHGRFEDVTAGSGIDVSFYGMGAAIGDFDNDGFPDVFISAVGENRLFKNLGDGKFADVTDSAGVAGAAREWSTACAWIDYDNDGDLDLLVANYVRWSKAIDLEVGYTLVGVGRAYGPPMNFEGTFPYLYRNDGNGRFTDVSERSGIQVRNPVSGVPAAKSLGVAPVDLDSDGWIDLVVANDTVQNYVFLNQRDGTFTEKGALSGIAFDSYGNTRGAMGIDAGYFRNDRSLGIAIGNFANEMTALYVAQLEPEQTAAATPVNLPAFTDEAITEGIGPASRLPLKFGIFFFDYDLDGRLDLLSANGHLEEEISKVQQSQEYAQPAQLFWNSGPAQATSFVPVTAENAGSDLFKPIVGRGSAYGDIDNDGDLDVILTQLAGRPVLLRNDQELNHHWVRVQLIGKQNNRSAIGALVKLRIGTETLTRQVMPTRSYLSQSELPVTFGLGKADRVDELQIIWPGNKTQLVPVDSIRLDGLTIVEEPGAQRL